MPDRIGWCIPCESDVAMREPDPAPSLLSLRGCFSSDEKPSIPDVAASREQPPTLAWLDRVQGPISISWWRLASTLPPSAHQVGASLWLFRNMYRNPGPIRWTRDRQQLLGTPIQTAHDGLAHLRRAGLVRVTASGRGRAFEVELTSPVADPVLDGTRWPKNDWCAIRGPISRPWLAMAGRAAGARSRSNGAYSRPGVTILVGLTLWGARNRHGAMGNVVSADITTITMLGTKPDAARRALRTLERMGLIRVTGKDLVEIGSPEPDPVLDGREAWRESFIARHGLVDRSTVGSSRRPAARDGRAQDRHRDGEGHRRGDHDARDPDAPRSNQGPDARTSEMCLIEDRQAAGRGQ